VSEELANLTKKRSKAREMSADYAITFVGDTCLGDLRLISNAFYVGMVCLWDYAKRNKITLGGGDVVEISKLEEVFNDLDWEN
jgi:hypothetical protein